MNFQTLAKELRGVSEFDRVISAISDSLWDAYSEEAYHVNVRPDEFSEKMANKCKCKSYKSVIEKRRKMNLYHFTRQGITKIRCRGCKEDLHSFVKQNDFDVRVIERNFKNVALLPCITLWTKQDALKFGPIYYEFLKIEKKNLELLYCSGLFPFIIKRLNGLRMNIKTYNLIFEDKLLHPTVFYNVLPSSKFFIEPPRDTPIYLDEKKHLPEKKQKTK